VSRRGVLVVLVVSTIQRCAGCDYIPFGEVAALRGRAGVS
jgi:hypothetical protein